MSENGDRPAAGAPVSRISDQVRGEQFALPGRRLPRSVAIVAMGTSLNSYLVQAMNRGQRTRFVDEVWGINAAAAVVDHDRVFHMDDLAVQMARAEESPDSSVAGQLAWLPQHDRPVYTSRAYDWAPSAVEYPLEWVLNETGHAYFNNTVPYAFAFALALGVREIHVFGCDYGYPDSQAFKRERGRACLEYWIAVAASKRVSVHIPQESTLLDACLKKDGETFYGYDTEWVRVELRQGPRAEGGGYHITREPRDPKDVPTAKQMEVRYSHDTRFEHREKEVAV